MPLSFAIGAVNPKASGTGGVPLPAQAHDGETVAQEPCVPGIGGEIPVAAVDEREDAATATIRDFEKQRAVALVSIFRADGDEVGGELDFAVFQIDRVAEIDDALVVRIGHGEGEVNASSDALVGSGRAELFAVEDIGTGGDSTRTTRA